MKIKTKRIKKKCGICSGFGYYYVDVKVLQGVTRKFKIVCPNCNGNKVCLV